jgi:hypothetical protein
MVDRWRALLGASMAIALVTAVGVTFFYAPISQGDESTVSVHPAIGFSVYVILSIALFDWLARLMKSPYRAAFAIAASQFILVNVDMVLSGRRGVMTAASSTILMAATWASVAFVYAKLVRFPNEQADNRLDEA